MFSHMTKIIRLILLALTFSACSPRLQVFYTQPTTEGIKRDGETYYYENDTLKVVYSFWAEDGILSYTIYNKLNVPLYIDWKKSSMVLNNLKQDYYTDLQTTNTTGELKTRGYAAGGSYNNGYGGTNSGAYGASRTSVNTQAVSVREERISFIPPQSATQKNGYKIFPNQYEIMRGASKETLEGTKTTVKVLTYDKDRTIAVFRNFFTYSTKETFDSESYVSNEFYVSKVVQLPYRHIDRMQERNRFYVTYYTNN